ncbi:MAG: DUF393 domain-containing protein [Pseudomonadota bacterium]
MTKTTATEVYFDGACPICRREIAMWQDAKGLEDVAFTNVAEVVPDGLDQQELLARFHVKRSDGVIVSGAAAFLALWRGHKWLWPVGVALDRWPFRPLLDVAYAGFLRVRKLWR